MADFQQIKPGCFTVQAAADSRRYEFDALNEQVLSAGRQPDGIFLGDSITQMLELQTWFGQSGLYLLNRGIGGDQMQFLIRRFAADVVQLKPKFCVLMAGINDSWNMDLDPILNHTGESLAHTLERVKGYFQDLVQQAAQTEIRLVICSVLPVGDNLKGKDQVRLQYISAINAFLQDLCKEHDLLYVDLHSTIAVQDGSGLAGEGMTYEGLHPTAAAYEKMAEAFRRTMAQAGILL